MKIFINPINSIALIMTASILSIVVPYGFPLFGFLTFLLFALNIIQGNIKVRINIGFVLFLITIFFYFVGILLSDGIIYAHNKKDITNIISFLLIWILLSNLKRDEYKYLIDKFAQYTVFLSFFVALYSLYKFYLRLNGTYISWLFFDGRYPAGSSLVGDYNMFTFGMITGALMSIYLLRKSDKFLPSFFYTVTPLLCGTTIVFAGSRRGWVLLILVVVLLIFKLVSLVPRFLSKRSFKKRTLIITYILLFGVILLNFSGFAPQFNVTQELERLQYRFSTLNDVESSFSQRTERWEYAGQMLRDGSLREIAFGSGFDYLTEYARVFSPTIAEDYPHNPIISSVLYSGLIGTISLILLMIFSFYMSIKHMKIISPHLVLIYGISWFYIFISFNSFFSNKLFVLLLLIIVSIPKPTTTHKNQ